MPDVCWCVADRHTHQTYLLVLHRPKISGDWSICMTLAGLHIARVCVCVCVFDAEKGQP